MEMRNFVGNGLDRSALIRNNLVGNDLRVVPDDC